MLRDDVTPGQAIAAVFPGGTITGCPKVRCMQILAGLEREPRDAYTGSLGYLGRDGTMDLNILIRTLTLRDGEIGFRTGAGIVADSVPEAELAETRAKAHGILRALGEEGDRTQSRQWRRGRAASRPTIAGLQYGDGLFETMAASNGRVRRFAQHMARLADGCHRLGMPMPPIELIDNDCARVLEGLGACVVKLIADARPRPPRLSARRSSRAVTRIVISTAQQVSEAEAARPLTLRVCETRLGRNPRLAGMKHLNRLEQVLAGAELRESIADEGLMRSTDDRLVCGTAANVFMVRGDDLLTPADQRLRRRGRHARSRAAAAAERSASTVGIGDFGLADLGAADEVFLTNAVRGIRPGRAYRGAAHTPGPVTRARCARRSSR